MGDPGPGHGVATTSACTSSFLDLPLDVLETVACLVACDDPQAFGRLLCSSKAVLETLGNSEPCWKAVAAFYGVDGGRCGPMTEAELGAAASAALASTLPSPLEPDDPIPGGWGTPAMSLGPCPSGQPGWGPTSARGLFDARHALEIVRQAGGRRARANVDVSWSSAAAPVACATYKEAVRRHTAVVGRLGSIGARAARVWARLERFLRVHAPAAYDQLLPGWRHALPPDEVGPFLLLHPSVAAVLAFHAGQVTLPRVVPPGQVVSDFWIDDVCPRRSMAEGVAGAVACYGTVHAGLMQPPSLAYRFATADPVRREFTIGSPLPRRFMVLKARPGGGGDGESKFLGSIHFNMHAWLVPSPDSRVHLQHGPEMFGRTLFLHLETGSVYGLLATSPSQRMPLPVLVRADGGGGILAWLERLADLQEAGIIAPVPASLQVDAAAWAAWDGDIHLPLARARGVVGLCGFPGLPLDRGLSPPDLAALASAHSDAGVGVALTVQVQVIAGVVYSFGTDPENNYHVFSYRVTVRLLDGTASAAGGARDAADAAGTWPVLVAGPGDEDHFPRPPPDLPALRAARLLQRRWVLRGPDGAFANRIDGDGVVGETPRLVAGAAGPHFAYASRVVEPASASSGPVLPGGVVASLDGAFLFEGEPVGGGVAVRFWARTPRMVLRVPVFRH